MKNITRRLTALLLASLLLGLTACGTIGTDLEQRTDGGPSSEVEQPEAEKTDPSEPSHPENIEEKMDLPQTDWEVKPNFLYQLQSYMARQPKYVLAAVYLGEPTWHDKDSLAEYFREHFPGLAEFLTEIPEDQILGQGEQLFCLVPWDDSTTLSANHVIWEPRDDTLNIPRPEVGEILFQNESTQPVLIFVGTDPNYDQPDVKIFADARGGSVEMEWFPQVFPDTFILNCPIDEAYDPLVLDFSSFRTTIGPDDPENWDPELDMEAWWFPPIDEGLADTQWQCGEDCYITLGRGGCDPAYSGRAEIYCLFEGAEAYQLEYSGVWRMEDDCLHLMVSAGVGTSVEGNYPVLLSISGEKLYICADRENGLGPVFFRNHDATAMVLTRIHG